MFQRLKTMTTATESRLRRATILVVILFNILYIVAMTACHITGYPTVLSRYLYTATNFLALLSTAETVVIAALAVSACVTYYVITRSGMNMSGVKGYIVSLIPTIFITIFVWIIKKKFFRQTHNKKKKIKRNLKGELKDVLMKRRESLSTEEETIDSTDQPEI